MIGAVPYQLELNEAYKARRAREMAAAHQLRIDHSCEQEEWVKAKAAQEKAKKDEQKRLRESQARAEAEAILAKLDKEQINFDLVAAVVQRQIHVSDAVAVVARRYQVTAADICSHRREQMIVRPRHIAIYIAKLSTPLSLPRIGRQVGGRDHTTAIHAVKKIAALAESDPTIRAEIDALITELKALAWRRATEIQSPAGDHVRAADAIGWRPE